MSIILTRAELAIGQFARELTHINRFRRALANPRQTQWQLLQRMLRDNADTVYGRKFNFAAIGSIEEFQRAVPAVTYDDLTDYIEPMLDGKEGILVADKVIMFAN